MLSSTCTMVTWCHPSTWVSATFCFKQGNALKMCAVIIYMTHILDQMPQLLFFITARLSVAFMQLLFEDGY